MREKNPGKIDLIKVVHILVEDQYQIANKHVLISIPPTVISSYYSGDTPLEVVSMCLVLKTEDIL